MLFLVFQLGDDRYALRAASVVEVLPMVHFNRMPQAPRGIVGVINYHGTPVPAIDLAQLTLGRPALDRLSTRLVIVNCPTANGQYRMLGLIAERVTDTLRQPSEAFADAGMKIREAPYLGPVLMDSRGAIQLIQEQHLLTAPLRDELFSNPLPSISDAAAHPSM